MTSAATTLVTESYLRSRALCHYLANTHTNIDSSRCMLNCMHNQTVYIVNHYEYIEFVWNGEVKKTWE